MWLPRAAVAAALLTLAACSSAGPQRMNVSARNSGEEGRCQNASGTATMFSQASAIHYAKARMADDIGETRSEFSAAGVIGRADEPASVSCVPYMLFGQQTSLITCVATTHVCAR